MTLIAESSPSPSSPAHWPFLQLAALGAVTLPTLIAYNEAPSSTFLNQALALIGWGVFLMLLSIWKPRAVGEGLQQDRRGTVALMAALIIVAIAALVTPLWTPLPWSLSLSVAGVVMAAVVTLAVTVRICRAGGGEAAFDVFAWAVLIAGALSALISFIQVFIPHLTGANWIASSSIEGRATGNLRQPNHLSSLLVWALVALVWLMQKPWPRPRQFVQVLPIVLAPLLTAATVLSASRTGTLSVLLLGVWGLLDRRLKTTTRRMLMLLPLIYGLCWAGFTYIAHQEHETFGGETRFSAEGDISSSRFAIWKNTLSLIAHHPWRGVGVGEFNFAWSLGVFPDRPVAFFDHTHNLPLQLWVEMGVPLGTLVLVGLIFALWRSFYAGHLLKDSEGVRARCAFMMVLLIGLHSLLEYPLWYTYFLLPAVFAWGISLGGIRSFSTATAAPASASYLAAPAAYPALIGATVLMTLISVYSVIDYWRVVRIFSPQLEDPPLAERIVNGQGSVFFSHHAHYALATTAEYPAQVMDTFAHATHFLLDTRLMTAWSRAFADQGDLQRARHLVQRLREFNNNNSVDFFAVCDDFLEDDSERPFQCLSPPKTSLSFKDFYSQANR